MYPNNKRDILQPELYTNAALRKQSTESHDLLPVGHLQFSLKYDQELEGLTVKVLSIISD